MDKQKMKWKVLLPTKRRIIQVYAALLYNAHLKGFIQGNIYTGYTKVMCVPGLNCYSCPGAVGACPLGALQNAIASSGHRLPAYVIGILMLYGLVFGRTICGFLCPFGLLQEWTHKIPTPKINKGRITRLLSWIKYVILAIFVLGIPLYYGMKDVPLPAFCKYICPAGTAEGAIGLLGNPANADKFVMLDALFTHKFLILLSVIGCCIFIYRAFCRFFCPLGAIYGLFAKVAIIGVRVDTAKCIDCGKCVKACKMDVRRVGDHECVHCGECIDLCPTSAITFRAGKYTIAGPGTGRKQRKVWRVLGAFSVAVLICTLLVVNISGCVSKNPADSMPHEEVENQIEEMSEPYDMVTGHEPGMLAPEFTVPLYGSDQMFQLSLQRGKIVIVNFWATWCTPCIEELPHFDELAGIYRDDVVVIAIHSHLVTEDVCGYLNGKEYHQLLFAQDQDGSIIQAYGGSSMLPQTVVIDANGVVVYNAVKSLDESELDQLVHMAKIGMSK